MKLKQAAEILNGILHGIDNDFNFVSIDSRTLMAGDLFFAIQGEHYDGHDFVEAAAHAGAIAAVVSQLVDTNIPLLKVNDTHKALILLAEYHRNQMAIPIVAVTGSCGKTTTRSLLESIFKQCGTTLASEKSYNNNIGVPLTLLRLTPQCQFAVCELGANHAGEIAELTRLVKPDVAIITNAAPAHLEGFGSLQGVATAKGEIFQGLKPGGVAIINADDNYADYWRQLNKQNKVITFGINKKADIKARDIHFDKNGQPLFTLISPVGEIKINLQIMGVHNVMNALAAAAASLALDIQLEMIKKGLESGTAVNKRLVEKKGYAGATIIDDSYNANPLSVSAAMDVLMNKSGLKILVLGDMRELGTQSEQFHQQIGKEAAVKKIDKLYCYGQQSKITALEFGPNAHHFQNKDELIQALKKELADNVTVLIKGSRSMRMELIVEALL